jgi:thiol:disulfide interchange protein DsbC
MRQIILALTIVFTLSTILMGTETLLGPSKFPELKKRNAVLQDPVLTIKGAIEKPESYILKIEARSPQGSQLITAILDKKTSEIYIGSAYDKEGNAIFFPKEVKAIQEGVAFSYGKGSKEIYIVTDPECPYCISFEKSVAGKLDDYKVHVILFPLSFHKKSPAMVEWIMQGKDDAQKKKRFDEILLKGSTRYQALIKDAKKPFVYSKTVGKAMQKMDKAVLELNVRGTPSVYDTNFNPLSQEQILKP